MSVLYTNNAKTTLSASLNNSATSLSVASSSGFPSLSGSHYFYATLDDNTNLEVVKVTAVSGTTWTIVRGQDNTSATAFSSGDTVELRLNAALLTDVVNDALASSFTRQDFTGNGSTTAFTLNKTPGSENDLIVFIEGVFQNQADYTLSGTTLTFDEAPASSRKIVVYHVSASVSGDSLALNTFSGDGSTTAFTMSVDPLYENNTMVFIDGVYQNKSTYSTSGTTLTFDAAPANGTAIDVTTHTQATVNVPVDGSVSTAKLAADAVTGAKIADDAIDSEHYTDGSIDTAHIGNLQVTTAKLAADAVTAAKLADDAVVTANITDDAVTTAKVADDQITLAKLAGLARGKIIYGDASGNPAALALGSAGTVLTSDGTDISWAEEVAVNYLPLAGGTMTGNIAHASNFTIDVGGDIILDAAGGDIELKNAGNTAGKITVGDATDPSITLDVAGDIILDADGDNINFKAGGTDIASFAMSPTSSDLELDALGNLTLDVTGDIILDADGGQVIFKDGGSSIGEIQQVSNDLTIYSSTSGHNGLRFHANGILPTDNAGAIVDNDADLGDPSYRFKDLRLAGTAYIDGNVGIGTTSPEGKFEIEDGGTSKSILQKITLDNDDVYGLVVGNDSYSTTLADGLAVTVSNAGVVGLQARGTSSELAFRTVGAERARIDASGNIQIVGGNQMTQGLFFYNGANSHLLSGIRNKSNSSYNDSGGLEFLTSGTSNAAESVKMSLDTQGNLGIGTTSPQQKLHIFQTEGGVGAKHATIRLGGYSTVGAEIAAYRIDGNSNNQGLIFSANDATDGIIDVFQIDNEGQAFIKGTSPYMQIRDTTAGGGAGNGGQVIMSGHHAGSSDGFREFAKIVGVKANSTGGDTHGYLGFYTNQGASSTTEGMRFDEDGRLRIGAGAIASTAIGSSSGAGNEGITFLGDGLSIWSRSNDTIAYMNRKTSNGDILEFRYNGSDVGSISTNTNSLPSDRNFKKDIADLNVGLDLVKKLQPKQYRYKHDEDNTPLMYGVIAQDLETSLTEVGVTKNSAWLLQHDPKEDEKRSDYKLDYGKLTPILIKAIQEQQTIIDDLKARIEALES